MKFLPGGSADAPFWRSAASRFPANPLISLRYGFGPENPDAAGPEAPPPADFGIGDPAPAPGPRVKSAGFKKRAAETRED